MSSGVCVALAGSTWPDGCRDTCHTSPLLFSDLCVSIDLSRIRRWEVNCIPGRVLQGSARGENKLHLLYELRFKWVALAHAFTPFFSKHPCDLSTLNRAAASTCWRYGLQFEISLCIWAWPWAETVLFCSHTLACEHTDKTFWMVLYLFRGQERSGSFLQTRHPIVKHEGLISEQSRSCSRPVGSSNTLISHRYASSRRCRHKMCLRKVPPG